MFNSYLSHYQRVYPQWLGDMESGHPEIQRSSMVKAWSGTAPVIWYDSAVVGSPAMLPVPLAAAARLGATPPRPWASPWYPA